MSKRGAAQAKCVKTVYNIQKGLGHIHPRSRPRPRPVTVPSQGKPPMPVVIFHKAGQTYTGEIKPNSNLVVLAGTRKYPYPHLAYQCGMGKCATCACKVLAGAEHLPPPNWKEKKQLADRLDDGYRLACQLWLSDDIELMQE